MINHEQLFSVIIVSHLQNSMIRGCIDSVLAQNYPSIELVVCDDGSADFDPDEIEEYINSRKHDNIKNVIVFTQKENVGTVKNANTGVRLSGGEFLKLIAGDDMLADADALITMADLFRRNDEIEIIAARSRACGHQGDLTPDVFPLQEYYDRIKDENAERQFELLASESWGAYVSAPAVAMRRRLYDLIGGFDEKYIYTEDWPTWLAITKRGIRLHYIDHITTIYRYGGISNDMSETNRAIGAIHYKECEQMLRNEALPVLYERGKKDAIEKCRKSIVTLYSIYDLTYKWKWMTVFQKIRWNRKKNRANEFPDFSASNIFFFLKTAVMILILLAVMYTNNIGIFKFLNRNIVVYILLIIQSIVVVLLMALLIMKKAKNRGNKSEK